MGVCKTFAFGSEWMYCPWGVGSAMIRCSSFGLLMYNNNATKGNEHNDPAMTIAPSSGPKSPSKSLSRKPAAIKATNCARIHSRMTMLSIRQTLLHLDSACRWDVDDVYDPCMEEQNQLTYMNNRESRSVRPSVFTETAVGFEHSSLRDCSSPLHPIRVRSMRNSP